MKPILILSLIFSACSGGLSKEKVDQIQQRAEEIRKWAPVCPNGMVCKKDNDDGDSLLFAGLLCLSGEESQCRYIKQSQGSDGRFWRSPYRVYKDVSNSFSRDMALGVLAYTVRSKDAASFKAYGDYIKSHYSLCPDATDERCDLSPLLLQEMNDVAEYVGIAPSPAGNVVDATLLAEAINSPKGFPLHLISAHIVIRCAMDKCSQTLKTAAYELSKRQPKNALFAWLAQLQSESVERYLSRVPETRVANPVQWSFERDDDEEAWHESMGWEWIYLANIIGGKSNVR